MRSTKGLSSVELLTEPTYSSLDLEAPLRILRSCPLDGAERNQEPGRRGGFQRHAVQSSCQRAPLSIAVAAVAIDRPNRRAEHALTGSHIAASPTAKDEMTIHEMQPLGGDVVKTPDRRSSHCHLHPRSDRMLDHGIKQSSAPMRVSTSIALRTDTSDRSRSHEAPQLYSWYRQGRAHPQTSRW